MEWRSPRIFLKGCESRRRIEEFFFCQDGHGVMSVTFFLTEFSRQSFLGFRTHEVATTVCTMGWCTYTHLLHAHFSVAQGARGVLRTHLHACAHTRMAQVHEKKVFVAWVSLFSITNLISRPRTFGLYSICKGQIRFQFDLKLHH